MLCAYCKRARFSILPPSLPPLFLPGVAGKQLPARSPGLQPRASFSKRLTAFAITASLPTHNTPKHESRIMKPVLTRTTPGIFHLIDEKRIEGPHAGLRGDVTDLRGDVTDLRGNVTDLRGDVSDLRGDVSGLSGDVSGLRGGVSGLRGGVSGLSGNVSGLSGDVSGLSGDVDACEITGSERAEGINIAELIAR